jgi:hypothetical protein
MTARLPVRLRIVIDLHQSVYRLVFLIAGSDRSVRRHCDKGDDGRKVRSGGKSMADDWTIPVIVVVLSLIGLFFFSLRKSRDKSIFTKPIQHTEIKNFRNKLP